MIEAHPRPKETSADGAALQNRSGGNTWNATNSLSERTLGKPLGSLFEPLSGKNLNARTSHFKTEKMEGLI